MKKTVTPQSPLELVKEIHAKVEGASEKTLAEAKAILAEAAAKPNIELYEKISKITETKETLEKTRIARLKADIINGYNIKYPHCKFISVEDMDDICTQYGLVLGPDQHFIGSMPDRAMKVIADFKLNPEDLTYHKGKVRVINAGHAESEGVVDWEDITAEQFNKESKNGTELVQNGRRTHYISNQNYFMVAAPPDQFEAEGMVREGNQLKKMVKIDDPAALKPVKYGYLVVYLWGEEAAIARMQNPKLN